MYLNPIVIAFSIISLTLTVYARTSTPPIFNRKKLSTKPDVSNSAEYEDPTKFKFSFNGEFRKRFGFYCTTADRTKSTVCSPLAAMIPIGKLAYGSEGATQKELLKSINLKHPEEIFTYFKDLSSRLTYLKGIHLDIAVQMYFTHRHELDYSFAKKAASTFDTIGEYSNMADPVLTANQINTWVQTKTHDRVKNIVKPSDIKPQYNLIVVVGVYFSGNWMKSFTATKEDKFITDTKEMYVPMMNTIDNFIYGTSGTLEADIIKMPYESGQVDFYLLLPHKRFGAEMVVNKIRMAPRLLNHIDKLEGVLNITLPRFKIETTLDLGWLYKKSTISQVFYPQKGMSRIIPEQKVYLDKAIHKTVFEMNDGGQSANPPMSYWNSTVIGHIKQCYVNYPFAFIIANEKEIAIVGYFNGEVDNAVINTKVYKYF